MEHLPRPKSAAPAAKIPYLCKQPYDGRDFLTYPERAGPQWRPFMGTIHEMQDFCEDARNDAATWTELQSFLQCWIFFGLLHTTLDSVGLYDETEYHDYDGQHGAEVLHTRLLTKRIDSWQKAVTTLPEDETRTLKRKMINSLTRTKKVLDSVYPPSREAPPDSSVPAPIAFREHLFCIAATIISAGEMDSTSLFELEWSLLFNAFELTRSESQQLRRRGWCPSTIARERMNLLDHPVVRNYLSHLQMPATTLNHDQCTDDACVSLQIDPDSYEPRHTTLDCRCQLLGPNHIHVAACLDSGTYPVLEITGSTPDTVALHIRPFSDGVWYIALSHVWADGLGNPKATALPRCQILRLRRLVAGLKLNGIVSQDEKMHLWCDTLLCPIQLADRASNLEHTEQEIERSKELKQQALAKMRDVYKNAAYVLVLDQELQATRFLDLDATEAIARVAVSRWMQRLWTYQEAVLAKQLLFQFADAEVSYDTLSTSYDATRRRDAWLHELFLRIAPRWGFMQPKDKDLFSVFHGVTSRQVTYNEDEPLVLAAVLGLDLEQVARQSGRRDRMAVFWRLCADRPEGIDASICFNDLKRFTQTGFHWAPKTLKKPTSDGYFRLLSPNGRNLSKLTSIGLQVALPGWRVRHGTPSWSVDGLSFLENGGHTTPLLIEHIDGQCFAWSRPKTIGNMLRENDPWQKLQSTDMKEWFILLDVFDTSGNMKALLGTKESVSMAGSDHSVFRSLLSLWLLRVSPDIPVNVNNLWDRTLVVEETFDKDHVWIVD